MQPHFSIASYAKTASGNQCEFFSCSTTGHHWGKFGMTAEERLVWRVFVLVSVWLVALSSELLDCSEKDLAAQTDLNQ